MNADSTSLPFRERLAVELAQWRGHGQREKTYDEADKIISMVALELGDSKQSKDEWRCPKHGETWTPPDSEDERDPMCVCPPQRFCDKCGASVHFIDGNCTFDPFHTGHCTCTARHTGPCGANRIIQAESDTRCGYCGGGNDPEVICARCDPNNRPRKVTNEEFRSAVRAMVRTEGYGVGAYHHRALLAALQDLGIEVDARI